MILNIQWPKGVISNIELYRRCNVFPLFERIRKSRWTLFGHILRMDRNIPARVALQYAVETMFMDNRVGRPTDNLFAFLVGDLNRVGLSLAHPSELEDVTTIAYDRTRWRNMCEMMQYDFYFYVD